MTQQELDRLAHEAQTDAGAMGNFTYLLGYLYLAGRLRVMTPAPDFATCKDLQSCNAPSAPK